MSDLCLIKSPSGNEHELVKYIKNIKHKYFTFSQTMQNSCMFSYNNNHNHTILLDAHIDTVHLKIIGFSSNNYVIALPVGFNGSMTDGLSLIHLNTGKKGIVVIIPPHLHIKRRASTEVYIDFGDNIKSMNIGDYIMYNNSYEKIGKESISAPGLDNKCSVFILVLILKYFNKLKNINKLTCNLILHFSSREETGLGSFANIKNNIINEIITLDTIYNTDYDLVPKYITSNIKCAGGPVITRNSDDNIILGNKLIELAQAKKIPFQIAYTGDFGGSNNTWYSKNINAQCQLIGIPLKYMHGPHEMIHIKDLINTYILILNYVICL